MSRSAKESGDVRRAEEELIAQQEALEGLQEELKAEIDALAERYDPELLELETVTVRPRRTDVEVQAVRLAWAPTDRGGEPAW
jgi:hypothetical protein